MLSIKLLGGVAISRDGQLLAGRVMQRRRQAVLAALAIAHDRGLSRDRLAGLFWPDTDDANARHLLSDTLYVLRGALGEAVIMNVGDEVRLDTAACTVDVAQFESAIQAGDFERAVGVYGGPLLEGFTVPDASEFEQWVDGERERLARRYQDALRRLISDAEAANDSQRRLHWMRLLAAAVPHDSTIALQLVDALENAGELQGALLQARAHQRLLQDHFDLPPDAGVEGAIRRINAGIAKTPLPEIVKTESAPPAATAAPSPAPSRSRSWLVKIAAVLALLIATVIGWRMLTHEPPMDENAIVILPFEVRGSEEHAYLREGIASLLAAKLDGAGGLRVVDPGEIAALTTRRQSDKPTEFARRFKAGAFVAGDVVAAGNEVTVTAAMYRTAGGTRQRSVSVRGKAGDLFELTDSLAARLLGESQEGASRKYTQIAARSAASFDAFKLYVEADELMKRGDYTAAVEPLEAAVALDSTFALAHYRLGNVRSWDRSGGAQASYEKAMRFSRNLPARVRTVIEGRSAFLRREYDRSEQLLRLAVKNYPDDVEAWDALGETLFHGNPSRGRSVDEARQPLERAAALDPVRYGEPLFHLITLAAARLDKVGIDSLTRTYVARQPASQLTMAARAQRALVLHDTLGLRTLVSEMRSMDSRAVSFVANLAIAASGEFELSEALMDAELAAATSPAERLEAYVHRARYEAGRGKWKAAQLAVRNAALIDEAKAKATNNFLAALPYISGSAGTRQNYVAPLWTEIGRLQHAEALAAKGRYQEAAGWFASIRAGNGAVPLLALSFLREASMRSKAGDTETAGLLRARALDIWRAADPEIRTFLRGGSLW